MHTAQNTATIRLFDLLYERFSPSFHLSISA